MKKVYHWCLPNADNLGDTLCLQVLNDILSKFSTPTQIDTLDLMKFCSNINTWLDNEIPRINKEYDVVIIGPGGLLSFSFLAYIFKFKESWEKIKIPIVLLGVGIISNHPASTQKAHSVYSNLDSQNHDVTVDGQKISLKSNYISAIKAATLISVRDRPSRFLVEKYKNDSCPLYLTGCPTLFSDEIKGAIKPKKYDLGLNITFSHSSLCHEHRLSLANIALYLTSVFPKSVWICHSQAEEKHAQTLLKLRNLTVPVVTPKNFEEVAEVYSLCTAAFVTKLHSAYFCLANNVPFNFISYDIKCDYLLEMLYDSIAPYSLNLYDLENFRIEKKLEKLVKTLTAQLGSMRSAEANLMRQFEKENTKFLTDFEKLFQKKTQISVYPRA